MTYSYTQEESDSFDQDDGVPVGTVMNWAGAIVSFALMTGLVIWGYQLLMRDVTGVPVVRALEGPMRVAPEDPGGMQAEYQDLSVTRVASTGAEEDPTAMVVLAPPPVQLTEEDQPVAALIPDEPSASPEQVVEAETRPKSLIEMAISEALGEDVTVTNAVFTSGSEQIIPASIGGVARSPRPLARPAELVRVSAVIADEAPAADAPGTDLAALSSSDGLDVDVAQIPPGTRLVQLGAYPSIAGAQDAWNGLDARFGDFLDGKRRVIQEASAGGTTFYRLRALGFEDLNDARRFCAVLVAENANCIPVIRR